MSVVKLFYTIWCYVILLIRSHPDRKKKQNPEDESDNDCEFDDKPALLDEIEENNNNSLHYNLSDEFKASDNANSNFICICIYSYIKHT